jgi:two-component system, OmpR family, sensor histidine kinase ChvG
MLDKATAPDTFDRLDSDDGYEADLPQAGAPAKPGFFARFGPKSLTSRIVLLNLLGLVILVLGILYFNQFRQGLIDARVQSLTTQAQIIAAAVAGSATIDTGNIVINPDQLDDTTDSGTPDADALGNLDFPINPETTGPVLRRLLTNSSIRGRIIDRDGNLIVDSRFLYGGGDIVQSDLPNPDAQGNFLTRWYYVVLDWFFTTDYPLQKDYSLDNGKEFLEVRAALNGAVASVVRLDDKREIIVLTAVPIQRYRAVLGALVLSTTGGEIDKVLWGERRIVFYTFGFVALVTILLSVLLAGTMAEPIRRLSAAAERVRRGINKRVEIPDFTGRKDEIGHLSGALRDMTNALYNRIDAIEAFAADVSHELKNPLTSLRSAVETLGMVKTDEQRGRLVEIVKHDVRRLDRLITDISDASRLDAELARAEANPVDLAKLLGAITSLANETRKDDQAEIVLNVSPITKDIDRARAFIVPGHESRLSQIFRNLIDNARSFTVEGTNITVRLRRLSDDVEVRVEDSGPGIRPDNLERIFERFYTDRPEISFGKNSGLGLSISKQIVEAHKGRIWAENRLGARVTDGQERPVLGARFIVRLPALNGNQTG